MAYLWHMHSDVLEGFYASEVYIAADDQPQAIEVGLQIYKTWLDKEIADYGYDPLTHNDPDDEDYKNEALEKRLQFQQELRTKLVRQPANGIIFRKT